MKTRPYLLRTAADTYVLWLTSRGARAVVAECDVRLRALSRKRRKR